MCYSLNPNYGKSIWQRCCVPDRECCRRSPYLQDRIPYCLQGPLTYTRRQKWWPFCCMPSGVGLPCLFVGQVAIQGSLESDASAPAIFVTYKHRLTNLTCVTWKVYVLNSYMHLLTSLYGIWSSNCEFHLLIRNVHLHSVYLAHESIISRRGLI